MSSRLPGPAASWLWDELHELFDTDDGSLPEIRVDYADGQAASRGFILLQERALAIFPDDVLNAADQAFHVLRGIRSRGVPIPDLGVFVSPDQLALDYRMGEDWGPKEIEALFQILSELTALDPQASLSLEDHTPSSVVTRFQAAWRRYQAER